MNLPDYINMPGPVDVWTDRLGWCVLHFLWQGLLVVLLLAPVLRLCRRGTAELRYALCGLALLMMALLPVLTWQKLTPKAESSIRGDGIPQIAEMSAVEPVPGEPAEGENPAPNLNPRRSATIPLLDVSDPGMKVGAKSAEVEGTAFSWQGLLGWSWLTGAGLIGLWRALGLVGTFGVIRRGAPAGEAVVGQVHRMACRCGWSQGILVKVTKELLSPAVAGVLRPVLLIPAGALSGLSPRELDFILAHEFAHIRRRDFLIGLLQVMVETVLFFHPAVWWVSRRMSLEREHACDDFALSITGNHHEGARALARLAELSLESVPFLATGAGGRHLLGRVQRLLKTPARRAQGHAAMLAPIFVGTGLVFALMVPRAASQLDEPQAVGEPEKVMRGSIVDRNGVILAESGNGTWVRNGVSFSGEKRNYPLGALAAHLIGYTRQAKDEFTPESGLIGLEKLADPVLHSVPLVEGKPQASVVLTLDARIQQICQDALREAGVGRGTAVILDAANGDILAMAGIPDFDPNQFIPFITTENWNALNQDESIPMVNRGFTAYPPGSTFKLVTALAAGSAGMEPGEFTCRGFVDYGGRAFNCWTVQQAAPPHGSIGLPEAIRRSCNCYFYQLGNEAGPGPITGMAEKFGLGQDDFFRLGNQKTDFMPGEAWWAKQNNGPWTKAKTANVAIGQGEVQATPLQMATVAAAIGNGGKVWNPRLISRKLRLGAWQDEPVELRHDLVAEGVPASTIDALRQGMNEAVNAEMGGTGKAARSALISIAGKTGTAQKWREDRNSKKRVNDNHAQFIGYAPVEAPRYAFSIVVANSKSGGTVCAPIARRIMERIARMEQGTLTVTPVAQKATAGHFEYMESVRYPDE